MTSGTCSGYGTSSKTCLKLEDDIVATRPRELIGRAVASDSGGQWVRIQSLAIFILNVYCPLYRNLKDEKIKRGQEWHI